jgi:hypothetical protein
MLIRSDSVGATYGLAVACRTAGVGFSLGAVIDAPVRDGVEVLNTADGWYQTIDSSGATREGAWVVEATDWWICRNGRPAPGWPSTLLGERGITSREKGRCRVLTPRMMLRPNVLMDSSPSRSLAAPAAMTL